MELRIDLEMGSTITLNQVESVVYLPASIEVHRGQLRELVERLEPGKSRTRFLEVRAASPGSFQIRADLSYAVPGLALGATETVLIEVR